MCNKIPVAGTFISPVSNFTPSHDWIILSSRKTRFLSILSSRKTRFARGKIIKSLRSARRAPSFARNKNCFFRSRLNIYPYFSADFRLTTFKNTQRCATKSLSLEPSSVLSPISHQATTGISYLLEKHVCAS